MIRSLLVGFLVTLAAHAAPVKKTHTVVIEAMKFSPEKLVVAKGDAVIWVNKDLFPHTVTAQNKAFDSRPIAADKSWKFTAKKTGTFPYVCTIHPTMKGELIVQ